MLSKFLLAAILAGVLSGVFATAVQAYRVTPLILEAEAYENGEVQVTPSSEGATHSDDETAPATHAHESEVWAPENGVERLAFTMLTNILTGIGFSLVLCAGVLLTKSELTLQSGLVWGAGGFLTFVLAPNFGLSPELPGMIAAELGERQTWWVFTVVLTAGALFIFAFKKHIFWMLAGLALLAVPHIYGAPVAPTMESIVPALLAAEFAVATIVSSLLFWLFLGGSLGWLVERMTKTPIA